ncbi:hypothetical protein HJG60_006408 [Phyllostomus discolor]|uniref:LRAT domain-containing protein n=1 Tax=Phyllostomus discolor TaxID=89673 RepID=A0A834A660_9CHIR|nr:hypothetical protein HJG60_006408 [Phyllostomus discolor]
MVQKVLLTHVAGGCTYLVNNKLDKKLKPLPVEQILSSAQRMIGKKVEFDISSNNCEHFVTKLRYGEPRCLQAIVKKELLSVVAGTDKYTVKNKHDDEYTPLPPNKIVQQAEHLVEKEMSYDIWTCNCEHFANQLRYGVSRSNQVTNAFKAVGLTLGVLAVGLIWFLLNRRKREKRQQ